MPDPNAQYIMTLDGDGNQIAVPIVEGNPSSGGGGSSFTLITTSDFDNLVSTSALVPAQQYLLSDENMTPLRLAQSANTFAAYEAYRQKQVITLSDVTVTNTSHTARVGWFTSSDGHGFTSSSDPDEFGPHIPPNTGTVVYLVTPEYAFYRTGTGSWLPWVVGTGSLSGSYDKAYTYR